MNIDTNENTSEIETTYGKTLRVTCIERKYRIVDPRTSFIIVAKKEFDEDTTEKMLHEDMELKTFLANYEIVNIISPYSNGETIRASKKKMPEIGNKEESEAAKNRRDIIMNSLKRRELFDSLDLPEEFLVNDYTEAIEKSGLKVSGPRVSRDDLKWFEKKGKVEMIRKTDRGASVYRKIKNSGTDNERDNNEIDNNEIENNEKDNDEKDNGPYSNQSDELLDEGLLPRKDSIDRHIR